MILDLKEWSVQQRRLRNQQAVMGKTAAFHVLVANRRQKKKLLNPMHGEKSL